jgi:hypothetical protein
MLGNLNGQQKGIIEERFKTVDRELSKKGLAPGWRRAAMEASAAATPIAGSVRSSTDGPLAAAAAVGGYYAAPGQLSSTAGLISLSAAAPEAAAAAPRQVPQNFSLQTADVAAGGQHPSMLLTGPPGRGLPSAIGAVGGSNAAGPMSVQIPEAAVGGQSAPSSATAGPPKYQPLQSFAGPAEIYAEWDKCLLVLQHGE